MYCGKIAFAFALSLVAGCSERASSAEKRANPDTLDSILFVARGGDKIVLAPGNYGDVTVPRKRYNPQVAVDATNAKFTGLVIRNVGGLAISGGSVDGPRERTAAVLIDNAQHIAIRGMRISGSRVGVSISRSQDVVVERNQLDGLVSDGINIAAAQRVRIEQNECKNFHPTLATYDAAGKLVRDGDHPDCIQGWSVRGLEPTADITIIGNSGRGLMQGVWFGNAGQGGLQRMIVRNNTFDLSAFNGIVVMDAQNSEISGNVVRTIPGAKMLNYPFKPVTSWVRSTGKDNVVCGNKVDQPRWSDDHGKCRKPRQ